MELNNYFVVKSAYKGKSKFAFWTNLKIEDKIKISMSIKNTGRSSNGLYAPTICIECDNGRFTCSLNEMANYLSKIDLDEWVNNV